MDDALRERLTDLLRGRLSREEREVVLRTAADDPEARRYLESQSALEALLTSESWSGRAMKGLEEEQAWMELVASEESMRDRSAAHSVASELFTHEEWKRLADDAVARAQKSHATGSHDHRPSHAILRFPTWAKLAAAAAIAILVPIGYQYLIRQPHPGDIVASSKRVDVRNRSDVLEVLRARAMEPTAPDVDTVRGHGGTTVTTGRRHRLVRLPGRTATLVKGDSRIEIEEVGERAVTLSLVRGSALFSVEPGRFERFEVGTAIANIAVTGTAFSTTVVDSTMLVTVIHGSVDIRHTSGLLHMVLDAGRSALVGPDTIVAAAFNISDTLHEQTAELERALRPPPIKPSPPPVSRREKSEPSPDARARYKEVRTKVLGSYPDAAQAVETFIADHPHSRFVEDILYDLGRMYEGKGRYEEALSTFERLLSEPGDSRPRQSSLYRRSVILAEHTGAYGRAAEGFEEYLRTYPEGIWAEESMRRLVRIREILEDREAVQRLRRRYLRRFADTPYAHEIAYQCAHGYRQGGDYDKALEYYELVIESYPRSRYREAAMYWAGWCLGEKGIDPERNRYFTRYLREFPRGEWRQTIAEAR